MTCASELVASSQQWCLRSEACHTGCQSIRSVVAGANEFVVNDGLDTGFSASDVVAHGVEASLGGVYLDDALESSLAASEFVLIELALGLAFLKKKWLGILAILKHLTDVDLGVQVWV